MARAGEASVVDGDTPDEVFVELNAIDADLGQRCGTLLLLNSRLIELNYILRERFPQRDAQELDTKIRSMREQHHKSLIEEQAHLREENKSLRQAQAEHDEIKEQNAALTKQIAELRELNASLSESVEAKTEDKYTIACNQGRAYMHSLELQLQTLSDENQRIRESHRSITNHGNDAIETATRAVASHKDAIRDMQALTQHLEYLDNNSRELAEQKEEMRVQLAQSSQQIDGLKQQLDLARDRNFAGGIDQGDVSMMAEQVQRYQEELSVMQVEKLQMEEGLKNQLDHERERVDKYRAKFESSKTHIRDLENTVHDLQLANAQLEASLQTLQNSMYQARGPEVQQVRRRASSSDDEVNEGPERGGPVDPAQGGKMLWGKRKRVIFQSEAKRRMEIEWCFVTTDGVPHAVVLQHTQQESKPKTRRRLTVDGILKYDDRSSATSFRIEINRDVLVVGIRRAAGKTFQYELQINEEDYQVAFQRWKEQRYQQ